MYVGWLVCLFVCCSLFHFRVSFGVAHTILYAGVLWCAFDWHFTSMFIKFYFVNVCLTLLYHFGIRIERSCVCIRVCTVYKYSAAAYSWMKLFVRVRFKFICFLSRNIPITFHSMSKSNIPIWCVFYLFSPSLSLSPSLSSHSYLFIFSSFVLLFCHSSWFWLASTRIHAHTHTYTDTM